MVVPCMAPRPRLEDHRSVVNKASHGHSPTAVNGFVMCLNVRQVHKTWRLWPQLGHRGIKDVRQTWQNAELLLADVKVPASDHELHEWGEVAF